MHPVWLGAEEGMPHVRHAQSHGVPRGQVFRLWRIAGRKRILHAGADLIFSAQDGPHGLHACLSLELTDGAACRFSLPLNGSSGNHQPQLCRLLGDLSPTASRRVSRIDILHMRCLHALDVLHGCAGGQRCVAEALFGPDVVADHWHADSDLRAQVRHILLRGRDWMNGGYLQLAGVRSG